MTFLYDTVSPSIETIHYLQDIRFFKLLIEWIIFYSNFHWYLKKIIINDNYCNELNIVLLQC